jgi:hypothetical protein
VIEPQRIQRIHKVALRERFCTLFLFDRPQTGLGQLGRDPREGNPGITHNYFLFILHVIDTLWLSITGSSPTRIRNRAPPDSSTLVLLSMVLALLSMAFGLLSMAFGLLSMAFGLLSMAFGLLSMAFGLLSMAIGLLSMAIGLLSMILDERVKGVFRKVCQREKLIPKCDLTGHIIILL